jgi:hypothetical protein
VAYADGHRQADGFWDVSAPLDAALFGEPRLVDEPAATMLTLTTFAERAIVRSSYDGTFLCDGKGWTSVVDRAMPVRIRRLIRCDGSRTATCSTLDGSRLCDGTYVFDGAYCAGDILTEEGLR